LISPIKKPLYKKDWTLSLKKVSVVILILCTVIFTIGRLDGETNLNMLILSISLAVAVIPEAMHALVTITLAFGAEQL